MVYTNGFYPGMVKMSNGLIIGKFLPFHKGHEYAINFAASCVDILYVFVDSPKGDQPNTKTRAQWIRNNQKGKNVTIISSNEDLPQTPEEDLFFWQKWKAAIQSFDVKIDYVFASETYGYELAEKLKAKFIPVDIERKLNNISGTELRENIESNFHFLTKEAAAYYRKHIIIAGPESCGKSTLTMDLTDIWDTSFIPEYGRTFYEHKPGKYECKYEDMELIAKGHKASINALAPYANQVLFIDTDAIATAIFSEIYHDKVPDYIYQRIEEEQADFTLLLAPNMPHIDDGQRNLAHKREHFFARYEHYLKKYERPYAVVNATTWDIRLRDAITFTYHYLKNE